MQKINLSPFILFSGDPDLTLFGNIQPSFYWSDTTVVPNPTNAWIFSFGNGDQSAGVKTSTSFVWAWAVRPGDVPAPVPEPGTLLLLGSGLAGLIGFGRKKGRTNG